MPAPFFKLTTVNGKVNLKSLFLPYCMLSYSKDCNQDFRFSSDVGEFEFFETKLMQLPLHQIMAQ